MFLVSQQKSKQIHSNIDSRILQEAGSASTILQEASIKSALRRSPGHSRSFEMQIHKSSTVDLTVR